MDENIEVDIELMRDGDRLSVKIIAPDASVHITGTDIDTMTSLVENLPELLIGGIKTALRQRDVN